MRALVFFLLIACAITAAYAGAGRGGYSGFAPVVSSISPNGGSTAGATSITITGTNFNKVIGVNFGKVTAASFTYISPTTVTASSPAGAVGNVDVTIITPQAESATSSADLFSYAASGAPIVNGVSPNSGTTAGSTSVTVTGSNFTGTTGVKFGATSGTSLSVTNTNTLTIVSPAVGAGAVDVTVTNASGTSTTNPSDTYTYITAGTPTVSSVLPNNGGLTGGTAGTIVGAGFTGVVSTTGVKFGSTNATSFVFVDDNHITFVAPAGTGTQDVTVTNATATSAINSNDKFAYADFLESYVAGGTSPQGHYLGGTEGRGLITHTILYGNPLSPGQGNCLIVAGCPGLWFGNGFWNDTACKGITVAQPPQVISLFAPNWGPTGSATGAWELDGVLNGSCHVGVSASTFDVVNVISEVTIGYLTNGSTVSPPLKVIVATGAQTTNAPFWARNDTLGTWAEFTIAGATGQNRSTVGEHIDNSSAAADYLFIGNDNDGIYEATFSGWPTGFVDSAVNEPYSPDGVSKCSTGVSACTNLTTDWSPPLSQNLCGNSLLQCRVLGIQECPVSSGGNAAGKAEFHIVGNELYRRVDADAASYWQLRGVVPAAQATQASEDGLRGLTCITWNGGYALIAAQQSGGQVVWRFDPNAAGVQIAVKDSNGLGTLTATYWGGGAAGINGYNSGAWKPIGNGYIAGEGDSAQAASDHPTTNTTHNAEAASGFWFRKGSSGTPTYTLYPSGVTFAGSSLLEEYNAMTPKQAHPAVANTLAPYCVSSAMLCSVMSATRDIVISPFASDAGQNICYTGFDNSTSGHDTAWIMCAPISILNNFQ